MTRKRQRQRKRQRKLLQKNKLQRKGRRSRRLSREPGRLEDNIREIQEEIIYENESLMAAVSRGSRLKEPAVAQAALKTVAACQNC